MKKIFLKYRNDEQLQEEQHEIKEGVVMTQDQVNLMFETIGLLKEQMKNNNTPKGIISPHDITRAIQEGMELSRGRKSFQKVFTKEDIPTEDILETPAIFFANVVSKAIFDDVRKGMTIICPLNPIKFKPLLRYEDPNRKGKTITQSIAFVWSKQQKEFLLEHTDFNITFFERVDSAKNYSADFLEKVVECYNYVKTLTDLQVQNKLIELNVKIQNDSFTILRKELAYKLAEKHISMSELINNQATSDVNEALTFQMNREQVNSTPATQSY